MSDTNTAGLRPDNIGEQWATGTQPRDVHEALVEVVMFLNQPLKPGPKLPTQAEIDARPQTPLSPFMSKMSQEKHDRIEREVAERTVANYLKRPPTPWRVGMKKWRPPEFVTLPVEWRARACGGCEDGDGHCTGPLELHHLHYRSVGCETPYDLLLLCREHHQAQHMRDGAFCANPEQVNFNRICFSSEFPELRAELKRLNWKLPTEWLQYREPPILIRRRMAAKAAAEQAAGLMGRDAVERRRRSRPWHPHGQVVQYSVPDLVDLLGAEELAEDLRRLAELGQADAGSAAAAETEQEVDGRWIGEVPSLPGVMAYGETENGAMRNAAALALRVVADRLEHGEPLPSEAWSDPRQASSDISPGEPKHGNYI